MAGPLRHLLFAILIPMSSFAKEPATSHVVLVHGFVCNRGIWNDWFPQLDKQRIPYIAINLEPVFASIESYAKLHGPAVEAPLLGGSRAWRTAYRD